MAQEKSCESSQIKLVYSGKVLQDDKDLQSYKLKEGASIIFMINKTKKTPTPVPETKSTTGTSNVENKSTTESSTQLHLSNNNHNQQHLMNLHLL